MAKITLHAKKREITGRKIKKLRKEGILPANVYGKNIKSQALSLKLDEFKKVYEQAGETEIVNLLVEGEKESRPILIQNLQTDPLTDEPLHVDLRQIILTEKITAKIPVELVGESPAVQQKLGILIQPVSEIEIEALPTDLPEKFSVDVSGLANVGDEIKIKDLPLPKKEIEIKMDSDLVIAKINPLAEEEVTPPPSEAVAEGVSAEEAAPEQPSPEEAKENPEESPKE